MRAIPPGFQAERLSGYPAAMCSGRGPTAIAVLNNNVYFAGNGFLYRTGPGRAPEGVQQDVRPWGLAVVGANMYATQPQCGAAVVNDPVQGTNCTVEQVNPNTGKSLRRVSTTCGFAMTHDPRTQTLTVGGRDGRILSVPLQGSAAPQMLLDLGGNDPAVSLSWSADGSRLFYARQSGGAFVWQRGGGAPRALGGAGRVNSLSVGDAVSLPGSVLTAGDAGVPVKALAADSGAFAGDVASGASAAVVLLPVAEGIYVAQSDELWLLRGRYSPAPPPATGPPPTSAPPPTVARVTPTSLVQSVAPPPPAQAPPPPPPPAPPAPPLATAAQVVAQPSAVANPAIVPGEEEREAAMRLAATGRPRQLAPYLLWLLLAAVVCGGGFGAGRALRRSDVGRYAWADSD